MVSCTLIRLLRQVLADVLGRRCILNQQLSVWLLTEMYPIKAGNLAALYLHSIYK